MGTLIWVFVIFISVLFHEFGHALTAAFFGQKPRIELVALGGLTYHDGQKLPFWKQFFIVFNGPLFGFFLFIIAALLLQIPSLAQGLSGSILTLTRWVNLFWTAVNLLPVMPLDGGQLLRVVLEKTCGLKGLRYALIVSMVIATLISLAFFLYQAFIIGALFSLLAFQSYDTFRRTRHFSEPDRNESLKDLLADAEQKMQSGQKESALTLLEKVRAQSKKGMIYSLATQYVAFLKYETGEVAQAYQLLLNIRTDLPPDGLYLLQKAAFEQHDYSLVADLAGTCFQIGPTVETALRNAYAHGSLAQVIPAVGWLQTAIEEGINNIDEVLSQKSFDSIRQDPTFQHLITSLKKKEL